MWRWSLVQKKNDGNILLVCGVSLWDFAWKTAALCDSTLRAAMSSATESVGLTVTSDLMRKAGWVWSTTHVFPMFWSVGWALDVWNSWVVMTAKFVTLHSRNFNDVANFYPPMVEQHCAQNFETCVFLTKVWLPSLFCWRLWACLGCVVDFWPTLYISSCYKSFTGFVMSTHYLSDPAHPGLLPFWS